MTQAPQAFTDAMLLATVTGINRYVEDVQIKKILKDSDGLGTEATRAGIIELLFQREYLQRQGKQIKATKIGLGLIAALPEMVSKPDMTAQWESILTAISEKKNSYQNFMLPLEQTLSSVLSYASTQHPTQLSGLGTAKKFGFKGNKRTTSAKRNAQYIPVINQDA
jgi:DNA topoisomerase-3